MQIQPLTLALSPQHYVCGARGSKLLHFLMISCFFFAASFAQASLIDDLVSGTILSEAATDQAMQNPKNASYVAMMEAFNILRYGNVQDSNNQALILKYLSFAEGTFADLRKPDNFSEAFSADADTPYRGRPHERVLTAMMLGIMDMSRGRYDMALPSLKNAEFLDARWQPMPYGSDAPMVYALMVRSLKMIGASAQDRERAHQGLYRSIRLLLIQEPLIAAADTVAKASVRSNALAVQMAHLLMNAGLSSALVIAPDNASLHQIIKAAAKEATNYLATVEQKFAAEYDAMIKPLLKNTALVTGMSEKEFTHFSFAQVNGELDAYAKQIIKVLKARPAQENKLEALGARAKNMTQAVVHAVSQAKVTIVFEGVGPKIKRSGSYNEVAHVVKSPTGSIISEIRSKDFLARESCGLQNNGGVLSVTLCEQKDDAFSLAQRLTGFELWSSSFQATSVVGRRFDSILKGRAQFKATTESIATVGAATALSLISASNDATGDQRTALAAAGLVVGLASGAVWLAGKAVNPEADPRFVPSIFESGFLLVNAEGPKL